jgi:hypothetical protein
MRNILVYGWPDVLGLIRHDQIVVDQLRTWDYVQQVGWGSYMARAVEMTFKSFWGVFGWLGAFMDGRVYLALALFSAMALMGCVWRVIDDWPAHDGPARRIFWLLAGSGALTGMAFVWYNLQFVQHQGRYLFTALIPIAVACAAGWESVLVARRSRIAAACIVVLALLLVVARVIQGLGLPTWPLVLSAASAAVLAARPSLPIRFEGFLFAAPFALLPVVDLYALFSVILPYLS